jgi:putative membrane protein
LLLSGYGWQLVTPTTLLLAAALLGIVNAFVRPIAIVLTFPITIVTLGLFLLVVNAAMVALVAWMLPGFHVAGFVAALLTALLVGVTGWVGSWFIGSKGFERISGKR